MAKSTRKSKKKTSRFLRYENTIWIGIIFFAFVWMFVLGILVGRGTAPLKFDMDKLQKELVALKEAHTREEKETLKRQMAQVQQKKNLGFYEALKTDGGIDPLPESLPLQPASPGLKTVEKENDISPEDAVYRKKKETGTELEKEQQDLTIQVASLRDKMAADQMVKELKKRGYQGAYRSIGTVPGKGTWYRVRVGHFVEKTDAEQELSRLKRDNYTPFLVRNR
jgi:cell division protein FtsN